MSTHTDTYQTDCYAWSTNVVGRHVRIVMPHQWRIQDLQTGAKVERRRHEDRGAEWSRAAGASIEAPKAPRG